ncbi:ankyrin repeat domain-containing protein [Flavobacterium panacagri]|uniref:ankyrin repeat domain-containing protein n=1 Tax=Flavobacterium panacagri TaxID=3034146 RepID=UPI0025A66FC8|nr:ankyrin repeat domain-containing protein [Flavobacterium panacagri]
MSLSQEESNETKLAWIKAEENPWGCELLDLRPFTQTMISTSENPIMAQNAVSYNGESGTSFFGKRPQNEKTIVTNLSYKIDQTLYPGVLFTPYTMENKWAIYFDGEYLIFIRSWLREVFVVAKTTQKNNELIIESITGEFTENESPVFTQAVLNFLLISHAIGEVIPAPIPKSFKSDLDYTAKWAFSTYGNMAQVGIFDRDKSFPSDSPLRSHSLLHIAVARGEINEIENQFNNGTSLETLAGDGLAPLHWSIAPETNDSLIKLLELGANPNSLTSEGATPIMNAVQSNKMDKLKLLLKSGALVNIQDYRGFTALHRAAERGYIDMVKFLLENGADKSISTQGHTALSLAVMMNQHEIAALLK